MIPWPEGEECLWQLGVSSSRFIVNKTHCIANEEVDVSQVHALTRFIEPESKADG